MAIIAINLTMFSLGVHFALADNNTISLYCSTGTCITPAVPSITNHTVLYTSTIKKIGIQLSQSCINLERNNIKSNCLTYDKLIRFDNTNPLLAGKWINDTWYHRANPKVHNAYQFANTGSFIVMVDPNNGFTIGAKMIIIQPDNFTYINPNESVGQNHTRFEYNNRSVSGCLEALVSPNVSLINDTIKYLENGCTSTGYNGVVAKPVMDIVFDLKSTMIKSLAWIHQFKNTTKFIQDCIHHKCTYKDPNSNW